MNNLKPLKWVGNDFNERDLDSAYRFPQRWNLEVDNSQVAGIISRECKKRKKESILTSLICFSFKHFHNILVSHVASLPLPRIPWDSKGFSAPMRPKVSRTLRKNFLWKIPTLTSKHVVKGNRTFPRDVGEICRYLKPLLEHLDFFDTDRLDAPIAAGGGWIRLESWFTSPQFAMLLLTFGGARRHGTGRFFRTRPHQFRFWLHHVNPLHQSVQTETNVI